MTKSEALAGILWSLAGLALIVWGLVLVGVPWNWIAGVGLIIFGLFVVFVGISYLASKG